LTVITVSLTVRFCSYFFTSVTVIMNNTDAYTVLDCPAPLRWDVSVWLNLKLLALLMKPT